jgi:hypothetical protein
MQYDRRMINAEPEAFTATSDDLCSLTSAVTGFTLSEDHGRISGVWLWRGDQAPLFVTADSRDIVFKFEVFTLAIQAATHPVLLTNREEAKERATAWPFSNWRVDVLWIRDWTIPIEAVPDGWYDSAEARLFGKVPDGAERACLVAKGLLFTGSDDSRLIIDQGAMPLDLYVTTNPEVIDQMIAGAMAMPLDQYLAGAVPTVKGDRV